MGYTPFELTDDEIVALHEYIVYGNSRPENREAADRAINKVRAASKKIVAERRADERSRV